MRTGWALGSFLLVGLSGAGLIPSAGELSRGHYHVVEIRNFAFQPALINAAPGDTVEWVNRDIVPHAVTDLDSLWTSGSIGSGKRWHLVVRDEGEFQYVCGFHPTMKGVLRVGHEPGASDRSDAQ